MDFFILFCNIDYEHCIEWPTVTYIAWNSSDLLQSAVPLTFSHSQYTTLCYHSILFCVITVYYYCFRWLLHWVGCSAGGRGKWVWGKSGSLLWRGVGDCVWWSIILVIKPCPSCVQATVFLWFGWVWMFAGSALGEFQWVEHASPSPCMDSLMLSSSLDCSIGCNL